MIVAPGGQSFIVYSIFTYFAFRRIQLSLRVAGAVIRMSGWTQTTLTQTCSGQQSYVQLVSHCSISMKAFSCQKEGFNTRERFSEKNRTDNNIFLKVLRHIFCLTSSGIFFRLYRLKLTDKKKKTIDQVGLFINTIALTLNGIKCMFR